MNASAGFEERDRRMVILLHDMRDWNTGKRLSIA